MYTEIPFLDCPEGVYVETVSRKKGFIKCEDWKKMRPFMVMLDTDGKKTVFEKWEEACRFADKDQSGSCNVQQQSVRTTIEELDKIAGGILGGK